MKISGANPKVRSTAGQIMVEACIALALMAFTWMLFSFVSYMGNNQIRTAMATRHAAWMLGNGADPSAAIPQQFFYGGDSGLVHVDSGSFAISMASALTGDDNLGLGDQNACLATVSFGMSADDLKTTDRYPFTLLNANVPFMPPTLLENFTSVQSQCAWPAHVEDTWQDPLNAFEKIIQMIFSEASAAVGALVGLVTKFLGSLFS